jgi:hypothetical protein
LINCFCFNDNFLECNQIREIFPYLHVLVEHIKTLLLPNRNPPQTKLNN